MPATASRTGEENGKSFRIGLNGKRFRLRQAYGVTCPPPLLLLKRRATSPPTAVLLVCHFTWFALRLHAMADRAKPFELRGVYVVALILALTGVVGALFIYLGPRATARAPGVVHVGLRYADEGTVNFLRYGKHGPAATLRLIDPAAGVLLEATGLRLGRNLVALELLPAGRVTARLEAPGYQPVEVPVRIEGRMLRPAPDAPLPPGCLTDDNLIGVRFRPEDAGSDGSDRSDRSDRSD